MDWSFGDGIPAERRAQAQRQLGLGQGAAPSEGSLFGGRYRIGSTLGRGGMGVVYRAYDQEAQRWTALKLLATQAGGVTLERFKREGELTAALRHPGIVTVHSGGELEGQPYLAYELVPDARTLDDVLPQLDLRARIELLAKVVEAVAFAHERGVIHRDLKPDNVLVTPAGEPRVADFGLASGRDLDRLTQSGVMVGTPSYMAPELISGDRAASGPHTDVWALGVILYEALTGSLPFEGDSLLSLAATVMRDDPQPPRALDPSLPSSLEAVCLQAIQREPAARYPHAGALLRDLRAFLGGGPVSASSSSFAQRALASLRGRRGRRVLLLAPLGLLALGSLGLLGYAVSRERPASLVQAATPTPTPTPGEPQGRHELGEEAWLQLPPKGRERLGGLVEWLTRYAAHPRRGEAEQEARLLAERQALYSLKTGADALLGFTGARRLVVCSQGELVTYTLGAEPTPREESRIRSGRAYELAAADGRVVIGSQGALLFGSEQTLRRRHCVGPVRLALSPDGGGLLYGERSQTLQVLEFPSLEPRATCRLPNDLQPLRALALSRGGDRAAVIVGDLGGVGVELVLWTLSEGSSVGRVFGVRRLNLEPEHLLFSPDGEEVYAADRGGALIRYGVPTPSAEVQEVEVVGRFTSQTLTQSVTLSSGLAHAGGMSAMIPLADGTFLTVGEAKPSKFNLGRNQVVRWTPAGEELRRALDHEARYRAAAVSPDGELLALVLDKGRVEVHSTWVYR